MVSFATAFAVHFTLQRASPAWKGSVAKFGASGFRLYANSVVSTQLKPANLRAGGGVVAIRYHLRIWEVSVHFGTAKPLTQLHRTGLMEFVQGGDGGAIANF